ncbi:MAG: radical SAM protein [Methanoregula sp.]|nr:MAG: radical SAM protein [Methanoregula sp.]
MTLTVVFVALYRYQNFPVRILHPLLEKIDGIRPYTIFLKNCDTNTFEFPSKKEETLFLDLIKELNPAIVSFTILSPYLKIARKLTRLIKAQNPEIKIIWGGIHPTIYPDSCVDDTDIICVGEGEGAFIDLVTAIRDGKSFDHINNLWVKKDNEIIKNPLRPLIQDLDSLPYPLYGSDYYYFIDNDNISKNDTTLLDSNYYILSSRGCPWKCSFCVNSILKSLYKPLGSYTRRKSVDCVISEIKQFLSKTKGNTKYILFADDGFSLDKVWLSDFSIKYKNEIGLPFFVMYHPKSLNTEILDILVTAGLDTVLFGIQSGSDYVRNQIYNRPGTNEEIIALVKEFTSRKLNVKYDFILDSPYEREKDLEDTIKLLYDLPHPLLVNIYSMQYFPNYPLTLKAIEDHHIKPSDSNMDALIERTTKNWSFKSRLFPYSRLQILKNIIWLIVNNYANETLVKKAVFSDSFTSKILLNYLNIKSIIFNKIFGVGRPLIVSHTISALNYLKKRDFKTFSLKFKEHYLSTK